MNQPDLTPVSVLTQIASVVFGVSVAMVVGPYIVICIGAMGGAAVMIMQREGDGNVRAFVYFMASALLAVLFTVPLSMGVSAYFEAIQAQWLFAPVSFALGFLGDKWPAILSWAGGKVSAFIDVLIQLKERR